MASTIERMAVERCECERCGAMPGERCGAERTGGRTRTHKVRLAAAALLAIVDADGPILPDPRDDRPTDPGPAYDVPCPLAPDAYWAEGPRCWAFLVGSDVFSADLGYHGTMTGLIDYQVESDALDAVLATFPPLTDPGPAAPEGWGVIEPCGDGPAAATWRAETSDDVPVDVDIFEGPTGDVVAVPRTMAGVVAVADWCGWAAVIGRGVQGGPCATVEGVCRAMFDRGAVAAVLDGSPDGMVPNHVPMPADPDNPGDVLASFSDDRPNAAAVAVPIVRRVLRSQCTASDVQMAIRRAADAVCDDWGLPRVLDRLRMVRPCPVFAAKVGLAYDLADRLDVDALDAYADLADEVYLQFRALESVGFCFLPYGDHDPTPYTTSADMVAAVNANMTLRVYSGGSDHPGLTAHQNWQFRAVHDIFGHAWHGYQFGPIGEENAYRCHRLMFGPSARLALTSETRGQNCWVNYGPHNPQRLRPADRPYAMQKAVILPEWCHSVGPETVKHA
jgi:hypothetical protein